MAENQSNSVAAVVLAGGASSRMGRPKALALFAGEPLAARALARLRPQAGAVYLNVREEQAAYAALGAPLIVDPPGWRGAGPLAGVASGLARAEADGFRWLATAPCDAPFLPLDLVARLVAAGRAAAAASSTGLEPMFALWPVEARSVVEAALQGRGSPRDALAALGAARVVFPWVEGRDPFANLNTPEEFAVAEASALEAAAPATAGRQQGEQS